MKLSLIFNQTIGWLLLLIPQYTEREREIYIHIVNLIGVKVLGIQQKVASILKCVGKVPFSSDMRDFQPMQVKKNFNAK